MSLNVFKPFKSFKTFNPHLCSSPASRLCRNRRTCTDVILSISEESLFSNAYEERSFGYCLRMTLRHSLIVEG
jgi:hypothetical protein